MTHPGESGFLKIVCDKKFGIPLTKAANVIHPYPTYGDIIRQIAKKAYLDKVMDNPLVKTIGLFRKQLTNLSEPIKHG